MNLFRTLLGLLILALFVPFAVLYSQSGLSPWTEAHASPPSSDAASPSDQPRGNRDKTSKNASPDHAKARGHEHTATSTTLAATSSSSSSSTTTPSSTTTTQVAKTTTTTSSPDHDASDGDPGQVDGVITGDTCPCTVTGTLALQGQVNLHGDLIVMGGTLVARPGVDVNGNGFQIIFMDGGNADFQGTKVFTWSGNGSNANLTRDVNFRNLRRIMFHNGAGPSVLKYLRVSDSGTPSLGDYPLHWHLNGNSTRGTIVEGVVIVNGKHHAFVPHGSHGITFRDTVAKNTRGDAYWWDMPGTNESCRFQADCTVDNSNDIVIDRAACDGVIPMTGDPGYRLTCFLLGAGSGNVIRNSVARNVAGAADCSGFHWPEHANENTGGNVWVFENNQGASACHGIFVWQNDGNRHLITGFSGGGINHGAYGNHYDYRNVSIPYIHVHAEGWTVSDSHLGDIFVFPHVGAGDVVFSNVTGNRIVVEDAPSDDADQPINLYINRTNLTCAVVEWRDPHPATRVVIDGQQCGS